jgi:hypothetical protein
MVTKKKYTGPNRRRNVIDRRQNKWFGWYINWLFAKPFRFLILFSLSTIAIIWAAFLFLSDFKDMCDCDGDGIYFEHRIDTRSDKDG